eukprot:403360840
MESYNINQASQIEDKFQRTGNTGLSDLLSYNMKELEQNIKIAQFQSELLENTKINDGQYVNSNNDDNTNDILDFKCPICMMTTLKPQECSNCQVFFCVDCCDAMTAKNRIECPTCRSEMKLKQLNRILQNLLKEQKMSGCPIQNCEKQNKIMKYQELWNHLTNGDCKTIKVQCPLKCGLNFKIEDFQQHLCLCDKIEYTCQICELVLSNDKNELTSHDCTSYLKQQNQELQLKSQILDKEKSELDGMYKMIIERLEQQLLSKSEKMEEMKQSQVGRVSQANIQQLNQQKQSANLAVVMIHNKPLQRMFFEDIKQIYKFGPSVLWRCDANQYNGCLSGQTFEQPFIRDVNESFYNCIICRFDLCKKCYKAYKDIHHHKLVKTTIKNISLSTNKYSGGYKCNAVLFKGCVANSPWNQDPKSILYHDPDSRFDVCEGCVQKYKTE